MRVRVPHFIYSPQYTVCHLRVTFLGIGVQIGRADQYDRVTIYRTLQTFLERGIIHNIPSTDNMVRYALCNEACITTGHHHDNHVHFRCDQCGKTVCLDDVNIPAVNLPKGYTMKEINMVVNGICKSCK